MSLISAIYDAIFTETPSDVTINERSLISVMLDFKSQDTSWGHDDFKIPSYKGKSLMLSRYIIHYIVLAVLGIIWLIYWVYGWFYYLVTHRKRGMRPSLGVNFIIGSIVLIFSIITLIYILAFWTKDVVLSPNNARINDKGVITVDQPCFETHSFFLLNSATYWTSTDIQVSEGDKVYITASGSMYSDIYNMYRAADTNRVLKYSRSIFGPYDPLPNDTFEARYCLYGRNSFDRYDDFWLFRLKKPLREYPRYGSLLYQICPGHQSPVDNNIGREKVIQQMDFSKGKGYNFRAKKSGVLYLTFNDILLDNETYDSIQKSGLKVKGELRRHKILTRDSIHDSHIWFQDNLGEVLVNVRIEKSICNNSLRCYEKITIFAYRGIIHISKHGYKALFIILGIIIGVLMIDVCISNYCKKANGSKNCRK